MEPFHFRLNALPEYKKDYVYTSCDVFLDYMEGYMDEEGWTMFYEQMDMKTALDTSFSVTSNGEKAKTIYIDGKKAYLITDDDEYRNILYVRDGYLYSIAGHGDADKLAGMLESVRGENFANILLSWEWSVLCVSGVDTEPVRFLVFLFASIRQHLLYIENFK